ncbi:MAG: type II toxin-antitoxin system VapC family toxin [Caulobacteraceae bacterium]|nr:type II toxin-antitoxin system VapC family toxin [Caulobacteraceae bacterium]
MIVVDASAILAIVLKEDDGPGFRTVLARSMGSVISAVNYWEVLVRAQVARDAAGVAAAETVMSELGVEVTGIDAETARMAARAFGRFGRHTPARLNLGDCFAYALATKEGDGLLFKGNDFSKTDIKNALDG